MDQYVSGSSAGFSERDVPPHDTPSKEQGDVVRDVDGSGCACTVEREQGWEGVEHG